MAHEAGGLPVQFGTPVPDIFADDAVVFDMLNGTVRISFGVIAATEPAAPTPMGMSIVGRLIMPVGGAQALCLGLYNYLAQQGLNPISLAGGDGATEQ